MSSPDPRTPLSPDDALPPVEPPTAGFIIRLFVVPALIVSGLFGGWLLLQWIVQRGADPMEHVQALRRDNEARWQAAVSLADALRDVRDPRNAALKQNAQIARELADILQQQLAEARTDDKSVTLRAFLCNALGNFQSPDVLPVLLAAARQHHTDKDQAVRVSAILALVVYIDTNPDFERAAHRDVFDALAAASRDDDALLRSTAAFGLGAWGDDEALAALERMLHDGVADVRYNAGTMLARHGRPAAVAVLAEMLDPARVQGLETEKEELRAKKRLQIEVSALQAVGRLLESNPGTDVRPIEEALRKMLEADRQAAAAAEPDTASWKLPEKLRLEAADVLRRLQRRTAAR